MYSGITPKNAARLTLLAQTSCGFISRVVWSRDGAILALAHGSGVWLWEGGFGGVPTSKLEGHDAPVKDVAFSLDSKMIATASSDTTVRLWDATSGEAVQVLGLHTDSVNTVVFSADGRWVASAGRDKRVLVVEMGESESIRTLEGHTGEITSLTWVGETLASGGWDKTLRLWDVAEGHERIMIPFEDWVRDLAASPDGRTLAAACKDGTVALIDLLTMETMRVLEVHIGGVDAVAFSPDGALLVTGGRDNLVKLWDVQGATDEPLATLEGHRKPVLTVAFHPSGSFIASGSGDNTVRLWGVKED